jgi:hypothetical protein
MSPAHVQDHLSAGPLDRRSTFVYAKSPMLDLLAYSISPISCHMVTARNRCLWPENRALTGQ